MSKSYDGQGAGWMPAHAGLAKRKASPKNKCQECGEVARWRMQSRTGPQFACQEHKALIRNRVIDSVRGGEA